MNTTKEQLLTESQTQDISIISHLNFQSCRSSILQSYMYPDQYPLSIFVRHNLQLFKTYRTVAPWQSNQFFSDQELQTCSYSIIADTVEIGVLLTLVALIAQWYKTSPEMQVLLVRFHVQSSISYMYYCPFLLFFYYMCTYGAVPLLLRQYICIFLLFNTFNLSVSEIDNPYQRASDHLYNFVTPYIQVCKPQIPKFITVNHIPVFTGNTCTGIYFRVQTCWRKLVDCMSLCSGTGLF